MLGIFLGIRKITVNTIDEALFITELTFSWGEIDYKEINE